MSLYRAFDEARARIRDVERYVSPEHADGAAAELEQVVRRFTAGLDSPVVQSSKGGSRFRAPTRARDARAYIGGPSVQPRGTELDDDWTTTGQPERGRPWTR